MTDIEFGGDPRGDVFTKGGGGEQQVGVAAGRILGLGHCGDLGGDVFCQSVSKGGAVCVQDFGNALDGSGGGGCGTCVVACNEDVDFCAAL